MATSVCCWPAEPLADAESISSGCIYRTPEIGQGWLAATFFSYGNHLEGRLVFVPWWPCNLQCLVISVHSFTFSQNKSRKNTLVFPFLTQLCECRAFLKTLTLSHHKALSITAFTSSMTPVQAAQVVSNSHTRNSYCRAASFY